MVERDRRLPGEESPAVEVASGPFRFGDRFGDLTWVPAMKRLWLFSISLIGIVCLCARFSPSAWGRPTPPRGLHRTEAEVDSSQRTSIIIPGPLRSFLRMAGISQKVSNDEVVPLLARNVFLRGYSGQGLSLRPTEFLILLRRYVQQANELAALAGPDALIRVSGCGDAERVLEVLGYRTRPDCGKSNSYVETADPQRAFLTIDSGFPLPELERTLQGGPAFTYVFPHSEVPILLSERDWTSVREQSKGGPGLLDALLHDAALARLYAAWSRLDPETAKSLRQSPGLKRLLPIAASLDYYGEYIRVRTGRVIVPGGNAAEGQWRELVGASPDSPGEFVPRLLAKDNGWLAAYFDSLARATPDEQSHFTEPTRLRRCYEALRGKDVRLGATGSVFRPDPDLLLLITRMPWDADGQPHVPGNLGVWKDILNRRSNVELARGESLRVKSWNDSEGLLEGLITFSRARTNEGPTNVYLALSALDARRPAGRRLSPQTVELMADKFSEFSDQYLVFSEFPALTDESIALFLNTAGALGRITDHTLRGNAMGIFQANVGLWQILARQGEIPPEKQDATWEHTVRPFARISSAPQLFDAGRKSLDGISLASADNSRTNQSALIESLAGPAQSSRAGQQIHAQVADRIRTAMDDQRLVSIDTLFALGDGLHAMEMGTSTGSALIPLAEQLREFQMPRPIFSKGERTEWAAGVYNSRHTELQMRTDLAKVIESFKPGERVADARGELVPFLRDTLVGMNYAYYEPPGSQALHNNPLLVRSHDFSGETILGMEEMLWQSPRLIGTGLPAGGGAHLVGSLADLPYVLGRMEEDFLSPENVQALIWSDLVPGVIANAVMPRWWDVTPNELHAVALYQRAGEELLAASAADKESQDRVLGILSDRMTPQEYDRLASALQNSHLADVSASITPADCFYLTAEYRRKFAGQVTTWGSAGQELENLSSKYPAEVSWERLSRDFGIPHPILGQTYAPELIDTAPFPIFEGYSSRLLSETWDSPNLYWARLADEMGYAPVELNRLVPMLTRRMIVKIFATELDDSPAILRAMREAGDEFRRGQLAVIPGEGGAANPATAPPVEREKTN